MAKRSIANACWKSVDAQPGMFKEYSRDYTERLGENENQPG